MDFLKGSIKSHFKDNPNYFDLEVTGINIIPILKPTLLNISPLGLPHSSLYSRAHNVSLRFLRKIVQRNMENILILATIWFRALRAQKHSAFHHLFSDAPEGCLADPLRTSNRGMSRAVHDRLLIESTSNQELPIAICSRTLFCCKYFTESKCYE